MAEGRRCGACLSWFHAAEDAWCGNCGAPCAQLQLRMEPDVLQVGNIAPHLRLGVTNLSCADLLVEAVETPPWMMLSDVPATLPAGATASFSGRAKTMGLREPEAALVRVHTSAGSAEAWAMAIQEAPALECVPADLEVWGDGAKQVPVTISPRVGFLRIRGVRPGPLGALAVLSGPSAPVMTSPRSGVEAVLQVEVARVRSQPKASLQVAFDGPHGPAEVEVSINFAVRQLPQIRWMGEHEPPVTLFGIAGERLEVVLANQAPDGRDGGGRNARLVIESVRLQAPSGMAEIPVKLRNTFPLTLRGGESVSIGFDLDLSGVHAGTVKPLQFLLRVETNGPSLQRSLPVVVRALPAFDGFLAIDFGSSNTCAAIVETGREYERLRLDGREEVSPTMLRYLSLRGPVPEVETGLRVKGLAATDDQFAASTISGLKRRLGDEQQEIDVRPYDSSEWTQRSASLAAADYLREVRRLVEANKRNVFREFILTHPAVCSLRQYRNLHRALREAFGDTAQVVQFLQEPIAALIPFFSEQAARADAPGYTIASFDLGGGTTDVAVVRVEHVSLGQDRIEVRPAILYSRGVRFGGEDLTGFLVREMQTRIGGLIASGRPGAMLIREGVPGASKDDMLRNRYALSEAAEQFKASLSDEGSVRAPAKLTVRLLPEQSFSAEDFEVDFDTLRRAASGDLKEIFLEELRGQVRGIAGLLEQAQRRTGSRLEYIQISGKTSYLPAVGQTLREVFPNAKVVRAHDPKECVVTGACLSRSMSRGSKRRLVLPDATQRTTSSVGLYDVSSREFTAMLPVDTPIPADGLSGELPAAWFGSERIALWENLGVFEDELREAGSRVLSKLGTWQPERTSEAASADGWSLRLLLRDFELAVTAVGPAGETIAFRRLDGPGDARGGA